MSNDAFYFGVLPVLSDTAANYGIAPVEMARAAVTGQPLHMQSPLVPALLLLIALAGDRVGRPPPQGHLAGGRGFARHAGHRAGPRRHPTLHPGAAAGPVEACVRRAAAPPTTVTNSRNAPLASTAAHAGHAACSDPEAFPQEMTRDCTRCIQG